MGKRSIRATKLAGNNELDDHLFVVFGNGITGKSQSAAKLNAVCKPTVGSVAGRGRCFYVFGIQNVRDTAQIAGKSIRRINQRVYIYSNHIAGALLRAGTQK